MYRTCNFLLQTSVLNTSPKPLCALSKLMPSLKLITSPDNSGSRINHESRRYAGRRNRKWHHWPNDFLPFKWERPKLDPPYLRTGDAARDIGQWDPKALIPGVEHSIEIHKLVKIKVHLLLF